MRFDGVLFDKDGTLFDFTATWSAWAAELVGGIAGGDLDLRDRLAHALGIDLVTRRFRPDSTVIAGTPHEVAMLIASEMPGASPARLIAEINAAAIRAPLVEAVPLVPLLSGMRRARLRLGVVTNDAEVPARAHLAQAGVTGFFDFVAGYDSGYGAKPDAGQLQAFVEETGLRPDRVLMVGDSRHDLLAGRAAGMPVVGVLTGVATAADLAPLADAVLPDIGGLPAWMAL